jgi:medium-chain acyl-[acyl-carrier-protein] hydrolase
VRARLLCFPYAGVGASVYARWPDALPPDVEVWSVQLPGRESRFRETPRTDLVAMAHEIAGEAEPFLTAPLALFGHSMGAILAFETARALSRRGSSQPQHLFLSARRPPHMADPDSPLHTLSDADFVEEIGRRYGGIPKEILADKDLLALLLPALRADIAALELHPVTHGEPVRIPITVFGGASDARAPRPHLDAWRASTTAALDVKTFPGGHFYLTEQRAALLAEVAAVLAGIGRGERVAAQ